jgi:tripartite-type tricarboxylate transporter receptor subunit TctC
MKLPRRRFLHLAVCAALPAMSRIARAESYPSRPVHIIVGYAAAGPTDIAARLVGQWLSERLGQSFVIDNRPGAASYIGTEIVAKAQPDGYTLLIAVSTNAVNATLYTKLNFNFVNDLGPVAGVGRTPFVMVVNSLFQAKTIPDFIAYAKVHPGEINTVSQGIGTTPYVCGELLKMMTGIDLIQVPYRGDIIPDLLGGRVQVAFPPIAQAIAYVRDGRLRALGVTTATRSDALPDVPAIGEFVPGYEASGWYGICAPTGTPTEIIDKLSKEITAGVADPALNARLLTLGVEPRALTTAEFGKFIANEIEKWAKVIKFANIKVD